MGNRAIIGRFIQLLRPFAKRPRFRPEEAFDAVRNLLLAERDRWPLWLPVLLGCGIGGYFALPFEPWGWLGLAGFALCATCGLAWRNRPVGLVIALAGGTMAAGFSAAQLASAMAAAPVIGKETGAAMVSGRVISVESRVGGQRVVLEDVAVDRIEGPRRAGCAFALGPRPRSGPATASGCGPCSCRRSSRHSRAVSTSPAKRGSNP